MDLSVLVRALNAAQVEYILIGGVAGLIHGSARSTEDLDIVYNRTRGNAGNLAAALEPLRPYPRGAPPGLPFSWSGPTIWNGSNFTLSTDAGDIDLLGEITGGGDYADLLPFTEEVRFLDEACRVLSLPKLIEVKRAAGRPKDFEAIAELELLEEEAGQDD